MYHSRLLSSHIRHMQKCNDCNFPTVMVRRPAGAPKRIAPVWRCAKTRALNPHLKSGGLKNGPRKMGAKCCVIGSLVFPNTFIGGSRVPDNLCEKADVQYTACNCSNEGCVTQVSSLWSSSPSCRYTSVIADSSTEHACTSGMQRLTTHSKCRQRAECPFRVPIRQHHSSTVWPFVAATSFLASAFVFPSMSPTLRGGVLASSSCSAGG